MRIINVCVWQPQHGSHAKFITSSLGNVSHPLYSLILAPLEHLQKPHMQPTWGKHRNLCMTVNVSITSILLWYGVVTYLKLQGYRRTTPSLLVQRNGRQEIDLCTQGCLCFALQLFNTFAERGENVSVSARGNGLEDLRPNNSFILWWVFCLAGGHADSGRGRIFGHGYFNYNVCANELRFVRRPDSDLGLLIYWATTGKRSDKYFTSTRVRPISLIEDSTLKGSCKLLVARYLREWK